MRGVLRDWLPSCWAAAGLPPRRANPTRSRKPRRLADARLQQRHEPCFDSAPSPVTPGAVAVRTDEPQRRRHGHRSPGSRTLAEEERSAEQCHRRLCAGRPAGQSPGGGCRGGAIDAARGCDTGQPLPRLTMSAQRACRSVRSGLGLSDESLRTELAILRRTRTAMSPACVRSATASRRSMMPSARRCWRTRWPRIRCRPRNTCSTRAST